jgi:hypothetical protein
MGREMRAAVHTSSGGGGHAGRAYVCTRAAAPRVCTAARVRWLLLALACAALLVLLASGCSVGVGDDGAKDARQQTLDLSRRQLAAAAEALRAGDRRAFTAALPVDGSAADAGRVRERLDAVFEALAPLPWTSFDFSVEPLRGQDGVVRVVGSGQVGATGPADRLAVVRYLELAPGAGGVAVAGDVTPEDVRRRYLMALHDPVVLQRPGFVVLADHWALDRARTVASSAQRARVRLRALGLDTSSSVLVTIYGSAEDVRDALAIELPTVQLRFFAHDPLRVADEEPAVQDVGVMGPWLRDPDHSVDGVFVHELAHAYTRPWFAGDATPPALLMEGVASAAEGVPVSSRLYEEVASGGSLWPLPESFAVDDVWDGGDAEAIDLGYEVGRSLVDYVDAHWGASRLEAFVRAVAIAEPTEAGMDAALSEVLGVDWDEFHAGWRRSVLRGE